MFADLAIGGSKTLEPSRAIMLYESIRPDGATYAVQATVEGFAKGAPRFAAWEPVTLEFVRELAKGLGVDMPREVLPASVLCRTNDVVAWWTPAGVRTLFFGSAKLEEENGEDFPVPALVWRLDLGEGRLFVRAFAGSGRPEASTKLAVAPFLNVYEQGLVCQGSMRRPARSSIDNLQDWESGFFNASGSSQLTPKATTCKGQLFALWPTLRGKKRFPKRLLLPAGETLAQFIGRVS